MELHFTENSPRVILTLDIGTSCVRAMICQISEEGGVILGSGKEWFDMHEMQNGMIVDIARVIDRLNDAIKTARKIAGKEPQACIIGFSGESMKGHTVTVDYVREQPREEITLAELKHIIHRLQWNAFDKIRKQFAQETGYMEIDIKLISASVEHVVIDNQFVANPLGFKGKVLRADVYNCFAPLLHYGALQTIGAELPYPILDIVVQPYALAHVLTDMGMNSCLVVDVGAGTTDIALVKGGLRETKSFAIGGRTFTKRLSYELNIAFSEAEKVKYAYEAARLDSGSSKIVREIIGRDAETWLMGLTICLHHFNVESLPAQIYLSGGGVQLSEIEDLLRGKKWHLDLPFDNYPSFSYLTPSDIPLFTDPKKLLEGPDNTALVALGALSRQLVGEDGAIAGILRKIVQAEK